METIRTLVLVIVLALVGLGAGVVTEDASAWAGCRPHWDGKTWDETTVADGVVVRTPHTETLCY